MLYIYIPYPKERLRLKYKAL